MPGRKSQILWSGDAFFVLLLHFLQLQLISSFYIPPIANTYGNLCSELIMMTNLPSAKDTCPSFVSWCAPVEGLSGEYQIEKHVLWTFLSKSFLLDWKVILSFWVVLRLFTIDLSPSLLLLFVIPPEFCLRCLESIAKNTKYQNSNIIIILMWAFEFTPHLIKLSNVEFFPKSSLAVVRLIISIVSYPSNLPMTSLSKSHWPMNLMPELSTFCDGIHQSE